MSLLNRWVLIGPGSERRTGYIAEHAHPPSCHGNRSHCEDKAVCHQECCIDSLLASVAIHLPFCCFVLGANIGRHVLTITTSIQSIKMEGKCFICNVFCFVFFPSLFNSPNAVLRLRFNHFATECSWDHMYIYDGDSVYAPLIAVFR